MSSTMLPSDAVLLAALERHLPATGRALAVYLFGSAASGALRDDSDVDLAVLAESEFDPVVLFDAAQRLATELRRDVDLVDLRRASAVMRAQVIANGRRLTPASTEVEVFEMLAFGAYARLAEERRPVILSMQERYRA